MTDRIRQLVILGGGSAGWLTAGVLAAGHPPSTGIAITLVESPDVKPIGVGEGTWPSMRDTLRHMGVSEREFLLACDASFKQASCFSNWVTGDSDDVYYHPFTAPAGMGKADLPAHWSNHLDGESFSARCGVQEALCQAGKAPKQLATPEFAAVANYAYHLDAGKFGEFLKSHCTEKLGVNYLQAHVQSVLTHENGDIAGLETTSGEVLEGDLFIDCSGFKSLLLGEHYGIPVHSVSDQLFCDTAMAVQVPYSSPDQPIASHTLATAQTAGWTWDIGLPTRRGVGYVYSSGHTTDEQAQEDLLRYVAQSGIDPETYGLETRKIALNPGYRDKFWHRNCIAVGISAGFIEPLEASALALIEMMAANIRDELPLTKSMMPFVAGRYNERFRYRWERVVEFLKLHYLLSRREDSAFWSDNRRKESVPERLQELMQLWQLRVPSRRDFPEIEEIFPAISYQYVLYGMGMRPELEQKPGNRARAEVVLGELDAQRNKYLSGLPENRELLNALADRKFAS